MSSHYNSTHNELDAIERQVKQQQQQQQHHQQQQMNPPSQYYNTASRNKSPNRSSSSRSHRTVDPRKMTNAPRKTQPPATGSAMARPYRGGFAAAAYETAREDFYFSTATFAEARKAAGLGKRTTPLPTI
mmetsp:Transcript_52888/g.79004  ORF Transcript_52888/g.79004 Transcript_52888/m.79004 type:complete len:130 (-) Transcript_52888:286-675(-)